MADSTRLPISHPDHSLGAGLGPTSETDDEEADPTDATDTDVEGGLPWKPKFNKVPIINSTPIRAGQRKSVCKFIVTTMPMAERSVSGPG